MKNVLIFVVLLVGIGSMCVGTYHFGYNDGHLMGYGKGYSIGSYEGEKGAAILCGIAVHELVNTKCPDVYKKLMEGKEPILKGEKF